MKLNQSLILKENFIVTFTYGDSSHVDKKNNLLFRSQVSTNHNAYCTPQTEDTQQAPLQSINVSNKVLAQSMYRQFLDYPLRTSLYQYHNSVEIHQESALAKFTQLKPKEIAQQMIQAQIKDFQVGQLLGKGALGNVYACRHKETGFFFALKKIKKKSVTDLSQFVHSLKVHMYLSQPNIVKLYSVFHDSEHIYLLMELCMDGNLKSQAKKFKSAKEIKKFLLGVAYGLRHLHKRNIRHGDIKLQNIICSYGMAKISDFDCISFGRPRLSFSNISNLTMPGSPLYFSPEMLRQSIVGLNDDVWSLGIICYQIICGYYPFEISNPSQLSNIFLKQIRHFPCGVDQFLENLTRKMLSKRICERPKLNSIIIELERD